MSEPTREERVEAFLGAAAQRARDEAQSVPEATVQPTRYVVSCLPEDHINQRHFALGVEHRGHELWAVTRHGMCLGVDGEWDWEMRPSERDDDWLLTHRFFLDAALDRARQQAALITVNGHTVTDALRAHAEGGAR